jgi:hypothetical protein
MNKSARLLAIGDKEEIAKMEADYFLEIFGGRKIKLRLPEVQNLFVSLSSMMEAEGKELFWTPLPDQAGECCEFTTSKWLLQEGCIPERIFAAPNPGRPIAQSGPLGKLCRAVGGVTKLAEMMECSVDAIGQWARGDRQPSGPARVLMNRIAEEYGLPTMTWAAHNAPKDPK